MSQTSPVVDDFGRDGFVMLRGVYGPDRISAAKEAAERRFYGRPFKEVLAEGKGVGVDEQVSDGFRGSAAYGRTQFPVGDRAVDSLVEESRLIEGLAAVLGVEPERVRFCNGHLFCRSGPADKRHGKAWWDGFHVDHDALSFLPPAPGEGGASPVAWVNSWILLHDIEPGGAPLHVLPGSHRTVVPKLADMAEAGRFTWRMSFPDLRDLCEEKDLAPVYGKAGDVLLYRSDLVHGAVPFEDKTRQRLVLAFACCRAGNEAARRFAAPWSLAERDVVVDFFARTTPAVRTLFGWPPLGDSYYTKDAVRLLRVWYPGIDTSPYERV